MLTQIFGKCDCCSTANLPFTAQEAQVSCKSCGKKSTLCENCKRKPCPECGGKLESAMDWAAKNNIMF